MDGAGQAEPKKLLNEHSGLFVSGLYALFTAIGLNYDYWYFRILGVPILDYAQPGDFLLAGLRNPLLLIFSIASVLLIGWLVQADRRARHRSPTYALRAAKLERLPFYNELTVRVIVTIAYFSVFSYYYAGYSAAQIAGGRGNAVNVVMIAGNGPTYGQTTLVGSTSHYLFLFDKKKSEVDAVPVEAIARLEFPALHKATP